MNKIYLDNAATTPLNEQVIEEMLSVMRNHYGNPSSTHSIGQEAKTLIENTRRKAETDFRTLLSSRHKNQR